jgi:ATP-dependent Clp protease ATP-binding subunit ClpC
MSEYMEKFSVSRLVGAPPGYVGYEEGGQLTEKVRRKPYSVVLLDEIEKAHPDVFNILLQVFDDGILTDSLGRRVDFKNTILIMTSNVGTREIKKSGGFGFGTDSAKHTLDSMRSTIEEALKRVFNPEFLNRIDDTIIFGTLEKEHIQQIVDIQMRDLLKRLTTMGITIELTKSAKEFLADKGYDPSYGARPLRRALQKYLEDPVAEELLKGKYPEGTVIRAKVDKKNDQLKFGIVTADQPEASEEEEEKPADVS